MTDDEDEDGKYQPEAAIIAVLFCIVVWTGIYVLAREMLRWGSGPTELGR
jgi:hypothetical protein